MIHDPHRVPHPPYAIAIRRDFIGQHYLRGDAVASEKIAHSHHYGVEVRVDGSDLNEDGYLVDILEIESHLQDLIGRYQDRTLNDLPEFVLRGHDDPPQGPSHHHAQCQGMGE